MDMKRKNIVIVWFLVSVGISIISSTISMIYWDVTYIPAPHIDWRPINDFIAMLVILPLGWLISIFIPLGWFLMPWGLLTVSGLALALYKKSFIPLIISFVGAFAFGLFWPEMFVAMMGV